MEHNQPHPSSSSTSQHTRHLERYTAAAAASVPSQPPPDKRPRISREESSDRRRRLTSPVTYPYHNPQGSRHHPVAQPGQLHHDLASRVLPQFRSSQNSPTMADMLRNIPRWQPDEEVQKCPVCEQDFTLFFRKHHCRKCGKVVCGDCSRHRITVPLRYIAHPPWAAETALQYPGAASAVRVCNPCVPDPWTPDNTGRPVSDTRPRVTFNRYSLPPAPHEHPTSHPGHMHRHSTDLPQGTRYGYPTPDPRLQASIVRRPSSPPSYNSPLHRPHPQTSHHSSPLLVQSRPPPPAPRREVKEEDECPVCGIELPPGEATREAHIAGCVITRFGSADNARTVDLSTSDDTTSREASSSSPTPAGRIRAQSYRSRGLYQYKATEKDCIDGAGEEQECPICFEEFQPGETLGRLECLCRFHHKCIREWWVRRGPGMCPVHASHE